MPLKNKTVYCVNHPDTPMLRNDVLNAVTVFDQKQTPPRFNPDSGAIVQLFTCPECGYVELYWQKELTAKLNEEQQKLKQERQKLKQPNAANAPEVAPKIAPEIPSKPA